MNRIMRYINKNRMKIFIMIIAIIFGIILIQTLNEFSKQDQEEKRKNIINSAKKEQTESIIDGTQISEEKLKTEIDQIGMFVQKCNSGKIEEAYNMLSKDCKELVFPTIEDFVEKYTNPLFKKEKKYTKEIWRNKDKKTTYKVKFSEDILETGGYVQGTSFEDYYTIVEEGQEYKLNINKFVYKESIQKERTSQKLTIKIENRENYIDNQIYTITFKNNSDEDIELYNEKEGSKWTVVDTNEFPYLAYMTEIKDAKTFILKANKEKTLKVKFSKVYGERVIETVKFENILKGQEKFNIEISIK